jgi:4-carboxymuconolactone decarboxylase
MSADRDSAVGRERTGLDVMESLSIPPGGTHRYAAVDERLADDLGRWLTEFCFGDVWGRDGLDLQTKRLLTITTLAILNRERQLRFHVRSALDQGIAGSTVLDALMHLVAYAGFPTAIAAIECATDEIAAHRADHPSSPDQAGSPDQKGTTP